MDDFNGTSKDHPMRESNAPLANNTASHSEEHVTFKPPLQSSAQTGHTQGSSFSGQSPSVKLSELLKGKEQEWTAVATKEGPLRLLDMPLDILRDILKEVTHTNDLTAVALTCSALHAVVTPMIYSRFDIVWPDASTSSEPRSGVDALTFGLATLVMREDLFENTVVPSAPTEHMKCDHYSCTKCGTINRISKNQQGSSAPRRLRRGNYFSQFTKKFSLGNGPSDWVQEYLVTKESGKMLGTLICLAIARMPNLESFVWDMPTGILRDIWIALSSLGDYQPAKLSRVWIRLHDNKAALQESGVALSEFPTPTVPNLAMTNVPLSSLGPFSRLEWSNHPTERPNFSTLPPLRSLTVLGIDEISYLEELSKLIGKSAHMLRELRIGLASTIHSSGYGPGDAIIQCFCLGSELALLLNCIDDYYDPRSMTYVHRNQQQPSIDSLLSDFETSHKAQLVPESLSAAEAMEDSGPLLATPAAAEDSSGPNSEDEPVAATTAPDLTSNIDPALTSGISTSIEMPKAEASSRDRAQVADPSESKPTGPSRQGDSCESSAQSLTSSSHSSSMETAETPYLRLETLELEGCTVAMHPLFLTLDFTVLSSLTLLNCQVKGSFWTQLTRAYSAALVSPESSQSPPHSMNGLVFARSRRVPTTPTSLRSPAHPFSLKRIHTDSVSSELITFLKETLAPNTLEWLFLQDSATSASSVDVGTICKGPLRRHRNSLRKVLIDSSVGPPSARPRSTTAGKWMIGRDALTFITSGKMSALRELAMVVEYKDWHFMLQRLPNVPHLRSLYIPQIINHVYGSSLNVKELVMGMLDVICLRPEIQLCYLGITTKCFEILEKPVKPRNRAGSTPSPNPADTESDTHSVDEHDTATDDDEDTDPLGQPATNPPGNETQATEPPVVEEWSSSEEEEAEPKKVKLGLKLREILFYDDKISIFKARHGRL